MSRITETISPTAILFLVSNMNAARETQRISLFSLSNLIEQTAKAAEAAIAAIKKIDS